MKVIIHKNVEVRAHKQNIAMSLRASDRPQTLPRWAIDAAIEKGCGTLHTTKKKSDAAAASVSGD